MESDGASAAFATAFNGVLTEGVEVVAIVLALGSGTAATMSAAAGGALLALVVVVAIGVAVHRPLARVPENAMKYVVGVMVSAFGIFWVGEGAGSPGLRATPRCSTSPRSCSPSRRSRPSP